MVVFITLGVLGILGYYFLLQKPSRSEKPSDIVDSLSYYEDNKYNKSDYFISYDPIKEDNVNTSYNSFIHRRCALIVDNINLTHYNNGEVESLKLPLDIDWYQPGDIVTIEDRLDLLIVSYARKLRGYFYYIAAPLQSLTGVDFSFAKLGSKVYRLSRNMTPSENSYLLKNMKATTSKFKDFNPPYKPHKVGGTVSSTSNNSNSSNDTVNDMLYNPLMSPYSPINVWNSGDDSPSSSSSWSSSDNDSSSSYDSGSSDSGGGDCGGD